VQLKTGAQPLLQHPLTVSGTTTVVILGAFWMRIAQHFLMSGGGNIVTRQSKENHKNDYYNPVV